ncbi:hypothetical protein Lfu02_41310 [Longispora fulva]|uniref:Acyl-CoA reductase-like NAD-dependent aldehyde dehydrogenase n=1 Tax=Longispora fulva TaxID=619741 RepID=A0A8J7KFT5_9ACTN|nr:hypothetical protein [Longispora fulva]MBG6136590.1 acyl-CoA reductase-like NAD-dependent aldehyde dehydrogenase [Longispora fulva]GIG59759.1 hypothetical protein Lfu02_41310 [Longispora fulva]
MTGDGTEELATAVVARTDAAEELIAAIDAAWATADRVRVDRRARTLRTSPRDRQ